MKESGTESSERFPCLDGMRAFCISLVMIGHLVGTQGFPVTPYWYHTLFPSAHLGVRIFFVVSGFLITHLLMREESKYGSVLLKRFYFRRAFRIIPAFYAYVALMAVFSVLGWILLKQGDVWHAATFTMNYHWIRGWQLGHIWSLSNAEQFYVLWPATLALLGSRAGVRLALVYVLLGPIVRVCVWVFLPDLRVGIGESFETVADNLATGCILAAVRDRLWEREMYRRFMLSRWFVLVPAIVLISDHLEGFPSYGLTVGHSLENIGLTLCLEWCLRNYPRRSVARFFNLPWLSAMGRMSYSLYLWQQLFLNRYSKSILCAFPQNVLLAFTAAAIGYWALERPFMTIRPKIEKKFHMFRSVKIIDPVPTKASVSPQSQPV